MQHPRIEPYTPRFQPPYRYPIALARSPAAGDSYWPGQLPPAVQTSRRVQKEVRLVIPTRSMSMSSLPNRHVATTPHPSTSRRVASASVVPLLAYHPHGAPHIHFNVEYSPEHARMSRATTAMTSDIRACPATTAPVPSMRLRSEQLPWSVDVLEARRGAGVSVDDVLNALSRTVYRRIRAEELASLDVRVREQVSAAFNARVRRIGPAAERDGLLRLDWLSGRTMFLGLAPTTDPYTYTIVFGAPS